MSWRPKVTAAVLGGVLSAGPALGSSHREAPFLTENPKVDATDFYAFRSYEPGRTEYVTFIANYVPLQATYGGPNYFTLDPDALYEIHIDNDGDSVEDITFQFDFDLALGGPNGRGLELPVGGAAAGKSIPIPLVISGQITTREDADQWQKETYQLSVVRGPRRTGTKSAVTHDGTQTTFAKPLDYIGEKTFPDYEGYADQFVYEIDIPGCTNPNGSKARVFVGQRREAFAVNLGEIFDLVNANVNELLADNFNAVGPMDQGKNIIEDAAVTSLALEVPIACVKGTAGAGGNAIGAWTTASLRQGRVLNPEATFRNPSREGGPWTQVSRLGMPLVNEVVIGLADKDRFNGSEPKDDGQFADYVQYPTLPFLLELLFPGVLTAPTVFPRADLVAAFLTGVENVNATGGTSEMLRLGMQFDPTALADQNALGAAGCFDAGGVLDPTNNGCDPNGFPNGRRPFDDVTDIELRVAMGYLLPEASAPNANTPITDGATLPRSRLPNAFPYLPTPLPGSPYGGL